MTIPEEALVPQGHGHPDIPPPDADSIRRAYRGLVEWIEARNEELRASGKPFDNEDEGNYYPAHIPFSLQQVLADYIATQEAIESLKGNHV